MHGIEIAAHGTPMRAIPGPRVVPVRRVRVGRAVVTPSQARRAVRPAVVRAAVRS